VGFFLIWMGVFGSGFFTSNLVLTEQCDFKWKQSAHPFPKQQTVVSFYWLYRDWQPSGITTYNDEKISITMHDEKFPSYCTSSHIFSGLQVLISTYSALSMNHWILPQKS